MQTTITNSVPIHRSARVMQLEGLFDVPPAPRSETQWTVRLPVEERAWNIGLIVGPSGSGKTTVARELFGDAFVRGFDWPADRSIVDAFPDNMGIKEITGLLSAVGFSSPPSWLRPYSTLSNGEQFRVTIARALAEQESRETKSGRPNQIANQPGSARRSLPSVSPLTVIDEFTSVVDRTVARIGSAAIAKSVRRRGQQFVAVSCHYDVIDWLAPDWIYEPATDSFSWRSLQRRPEIKLEICRVHRKAWRVFERHHYLDSRLSPAARCFVGSAFGEPAAFTAVVHFPHPTRSGWREHRTVCLPDFQGVGIGNAVSEFVAGLFRATGKPYRSVTSSPAMIHHRARSPIWRMTRPPSLTGLQKMSALNRTCAWNRFTASFEYAGPPLYEEARAFGLTRVAASSNDQRPTTNDQ